MNSRKSRAAVAALGALIAALACAALLAPIAGAAPFGPYGALFSSGPDGVPRHQERVAIDRASGNVLVTNQVTDTVDVYAPAGTSGTLLTSFGAGELSDPFGIAVDQRTGAVYVSDAGNNRIARYTVVPGDPPAYTPDGAFTGPAQGSGAGEIGSFAAPLAIDGAADRLLVADPGNQRVLRLTLTGADGGLDFDGSDSPDGVFTGLLDIAVDSTGDVVVVDSTGDVANGGGDSRVLRFDAAGTYEARIGAALSRPATVAIRPQGDEVLVSWNQDAVTRDESAQIDLFASDGTGLGTLPAAPAALYSVITGMAVADGSDGSLYVGTDVDRAFGGAYGTWSVQTYVPPSAPTVADEAVATAGIAVADVTGTVATNGADTSYRVEFGRAGEGYGESSAVEVLPHAADPQTVTVRLTGLEPDTDYEFRFVVDNGVGGPVTGSGGTFSTLPSLALATLGAATDVTRGAATVHAQIETHGAVGRYAFTVAEVGGPERHALPLTELPASFGPTAVSGRVGGLSPGKTYTVELHVRTVSGTVIPAPVRFSTLPLPARPPVSRGGDDGTRAYGCAAPRLTGTSGTARRGGQLTLTGSDLGTYGVVTVDGVQAEIRAYAADRVTVVVPDDAARRARVTLDCGRATQPLTVAVGGAGALRPTLAAANVRGARATLSVRTPGRGVVLVRGGRLLRAGSARSTRTGTVRVGVVLSRAGRRALARARSGRLRVPVTVRFQPPRGGGSATTLRATLLFRR
ncbi:hypothetical protein VSS74_19225 [Conexibacter stalactiti]|uniref:Fibronectin type-III domain-containing protein n=1 Tax=Conexibacter stalactiti TaxID=1940611 RepID=A0ABU4HT40_9ACTN|nr:hypothetical protein [Conexibacter stalactiti]MDW5596487.1 hypothetical protein [Conexibacter stalactiti]MEC5037129.1 hypothetical protein [Conexibacter stalactiti]